MADQKYEQQRKRAIFTTTTFIIAAAALSALAFIISYIVKSRIAAEDAIAKAKYEDIAKRQTAAITSQFPAFKDIPNAENNFAPVGAPSYENIVSPWPLESVKTLAEVLGTKPTNASSRRYTSPLQRAAAAVALQGAGDDFAALDEEDEEAPASESGELPPMTEERQREMDLAQRREWNINSVKYCGEEGWVYVPSEETKKHPGSRGRCLKQCPLGEDFDIWRAPAGTKANRSYEWVCKKRCPIGTQDQDGFCRRRLFNPEWLVGYRPVIVKKSKNEEEKKPGDGGIIPGTPTVPSFGFGDHVMSDALYCGASRHYGRFCIKVGSESNKGDFSKTPMDCSQSDGFKSTDSKLSCYKCRPGTTIVGNEDTGYLCAEPCPSGSTYDGTGTTYACYVKSTPFSDKTNIIAPFTEEDVANRERQQKARQ